jgi:cytoskeleton-associated protein 5
MSAAFDGYLWLVNVMQEAGLPLIGFWILRKTSLWCQSPFYVPIEESGACRSDCSSDSKTNPSILLAQLVGDVNLAVAVEAVQAIGNLASGLRKDFTAGARLLLPVLLDKLKEKKQVMVEALTLTLNELHKNGCILLTEVVEGKFFQAF